MNDSSGDGGLAPQFFTSIPALSEAASYLSQTTSYFSQCFTGLADESVPRYDNLREQEMKTLSSNVTSSSSSDHMSSSGRWSQISESVSDVSAGPSLDNENRRRSNRSSSQDSNQVVQSTQNTQNGFSIFQGLISRARRTVRGSADDIGWLQHSPGMPPVEDGTKRFMELLDNVRKGEHKLPDSVVYLLVPGFSRKKCQRNKEYIEEIYWGSRKRVLLLGHSKGGVDTAAALSLYWSDLKDKVAGLALAQSPYGGSPIASDILREGQLGDYVQLRKIMEIMICKVLKGDLQALEDLTYDKRREFLTKHPLPPELPVVSFHTEASLAPAVLATLSHVAHAELPAVSNSQSTKLPVVMPLAAAMAACAQLMQVRYGEKSDGLVTRRDAEVPGSVVVRLEQKLDHAWMVYSSLSDDPEETSASQVCEALLAQLVEIGQRRRHECSMKDE
ncbi:hypothetical protein QJS10_CPA10g00936 [Acorus calamus]|uniref:Uncharacterized protein n=1 Tax=Acorus calamus TaxID=4465 RepID=A0AAV9E1B0_ACOCL|nr:hypothetical protein QJS10_CPA10g00936 [Acorus calamus]